MKHSTGWLALSIGLLAVLACDSQVDPFDAALARVQEGQQAIDTCESSSEGLEMMKCVNDAFSEVGVWWQENRENLAALTDVQTQELHADMAALNGRVQQMAMQFVPESPATPEAPAGAAAPESEETSEVAEASDSADSSPDEAASPASPDPGAD